MMKEPWLVALRGKEVIQSSHQAQPGSAALPNSLVCRIVSAACPRLLSHILITIYYTTRLSQHVTATRAMSG